MSKFTQATRQFILVIHHKTIIGEGTIRLLEFNAVERIIERIELIAAGVYP